MLLAKYDTEAEIPEALRDLYAQNEGDDDGPYWLQIDDRQLEILPKVRGLATANAENRRKRDQFRADAEAYRQLKAKLPDDFDPAEIEELRKKGGGDEAVKAQYQARIDKMKRDHETELSTIKGQLTQTAAQLDDVARRRDLRKALRTHGVDPTHDSILMDHLGRRVKVELDVDTGSRRTSVDTSLGTVEVDEFIKEWVKADGKPYLETAAGPGGNPGGNSRDRLNKGQRNPFLKQFWNKTEQAKLPLERREGLARAAGFRDFKTAAEASAPVM